jgi:hypothetical protein
MAAFYSKWRSCVFAFVLAFALAAGSAAKWPDPERLAPEIRAFARADSALPPPAGAIVCVGSSSIRMWHPTLAHDLAPLTVVPRGFGGSTMQDLLHYLGPLVLTARPRAVLLYEGDNDLLEGASPSEIAALLDTVVTGSAARCRERACTCCRSSRARRAARCGRAPSRRMHGFAKPAHGIR